MTRKNRPRKRGRKKRKQTAREIPAELQEDVDAVIDEQLALNEELCPHGNRPEDCQPCMVLGDFAFESQREREHFGRW